jgi:hypothetical protein
VIKSCWRSISEVIDAEMATKPVWPTREDYWSRRWLYTKSGTPENHSTLMDWDGATEHTTAPFLERSTPQHCSLEDDYINGLRQYNG